MTGRAVAVRREAVSWLWCLGATHRGLGLGPGHGGMRMVVDIVMASVGVCSRITDARRTQLGTDLHIETDLIDGQAAAVLKRRAHSR